MRAPVRRPSFSPLSAAFAPAGLVLIVRAFDLGLGDAAEPGPGLWPAFVGTGLMVCGLLPDASAPAAAKRIRSTANVRALKGLSLGCAPWIALLAPLGWIPATTLAGIACGRAAGNGWRDILIPLFVLMAGLGLGVEHLLRFPLPGGLWERAVNALAAWLTGAGGL